MVALCRSYLWQKRELPEYEMWPFSQIPCRWWKLCCYVHITVFPSAWYGSLDMINQNRCGPLTAVILFQLSWVCVGTYMHQVGY